jgi:putative methyltransferase (TIGR04325 family)
MSSIKKFARDWLPPAVVRFLQQRRSSGLCFEGDFATWEEASAHCTGYDAKDILEKVLAATLTVKRGEAVFERDSVLFDEIEYDWPVLAGLMWAAASSRGKLNVLDFGGALGSSYFQNRQFLKTLTDVKWSVVEQSHYVDAGRNHIQDEQLRFYKTIEECIAENQPNVILLSSVIQYLPKPDVVLKDLIRIDASVFILDKTIVNLGECDKIYVQHIPESIYTASYSCWSFSESCLIKEFRKHYQLLTSFPSINFPALSSIASEFKGFIFTKGMANEVNN